MINVESWDTVTIAGLRGTGKTTLAKYLASQVPEENLLIYDPLAQYTAFPDKCRHIPEGNSQTEFNNVCHYLCGVKNTLFVIEEAERYLRQGRELGVDAFDLINRGRNWGNGIIVVTRRIQTLSKDYFDLSQHVFIYSCGLKSRGYIADMIGKECVQKIIQLKKYHFLYYNVETEEHHVYYLDIEGTRPHIEGGNLDPEIGKKTERDDRYTQEGEELARKRQAKDGEKR